MCLCVCECVCECVCVCVSAHGICCYPKSTQNNSGNCIQQCTSSFIFYMQPRSKSRLYIRQCTSFFFDGDQVKVKEAKPHCVFTHTPHTHHTHTPHHTHTHTHRTHIHTQDGNPLCQHTNGLEVGLARTVYMQSVFGDFPAKIPYIHHTHIGFWPTLLRSGYSPKASCTTFSLSFSSQITRSHNRPLHRLSDL